MNLMANIMFLVLFLSSHPLVYGVQISSKASTIAVNDNLFNVPCWHLSLQAWEDCQSSGCGTQVPVYPLLAELLDVETPVPEWSSTSEETASHSSEPEGHGR